MIQILVPSLNPSHLSLAVVYCGNELTRRGHEVRVFVQDKGRPSVRPIFPVFDSAYAYLNTEPMIVVGLSPLRASFVSPSNRKVLFYSWDLEWTQRGVFRWSDMRGYYQSHPVLARSESHARVLANTWGSMVAGVLEDFDPDETEKVIRCLPTNIS